MFYRLGYIFYPQPKQLILQQEVVIGVLPLLGTMASQQVVQQTGMRTSFIIKPGHNVSISGNISCDILQETEVNLSHVVIYVRGKLSMIQTSRTCLFIPNPEGATLNFNGGGSGLFIENGGMVDGNGGFYNSMTQNSFSLFPVWSDFVDGDVLGPVTVGAPNNPLPIELVSWNIEQTDFGFEANWSTATEKNNSFFTIEESVDSKDFYPIETINTEEPNSFEQKSYSYPFKPIAKQNILYYRLKQTDLDGKYTYSDVVALKQYFSEIVVFPNPVVEKEFSIYSLDDEIAEVRITNIHGEEISFSKQVANHDKTIQINLTEHTPSGMYVLVFKTNNNLMKKQLIVK